MSFFSFVVTPWLTQLMWCKKYQPLTSHIYLHHSIKGESSCTSSLGIWATWSPSPLIKLSESSLINGKNSGFFFYHWINHHLIFLFQFNQGYDKHHAELNCKGHTLAKSVLTLLLTDPSLLMSWRENIVWKCIFGSQLCFLKDQNWKSFIKSFEFCQLKVYFCGNFLFF